MRARSATMALFIGLGLTTFGAAGAKAQEGAPPAGYYNQQWTHNPDEYRSDTPRRPDVNNREEYRHPHVPHEARHEYREAFRRGYDVGVQHIMNGGRHDHDDDRH
jgi:hypothetical protein